MIAILLWQTIMMIVLWYHYLKAIANRADPPCCGWSWAGNEHLGVPSAPAKTLSAPPKLCGTVANLASSAAVSRSRASWAQRWAGHEHPQHHGEQVMSTLSTTVSRWWAPWAPRWASHEHPKHYGEQVMSTLSTSTNFLPPQSYVERRPV